jgi:hypothetical protein
MRAVDLSKADFERVFGPREPMEAGTRKRSCRSCGGWHDLNKPWPHNCRPPAPPKNPDLATPQIAPPFQAFKTGELDGAEIITNRHEKREYMERHDLVEYDAGVKPDNPSEREIEREYVQDFKRFMETDPLNIEPIDRVGEMDNDGAGDITVDDIEVAK